LGEEGANGDEEEEEDDDEAVGETAGLGPDRPLITPMLSLILGVGGGGDASCSLELEGPLSDALFLPEKMLLYSFIRELTASLAGESSPAPMSSLGKPSAWSPAFASPAAANDDDDGGFSTLRTWCRKCSGKGLAAEPPLDISLGPTVCPLRLPFLVTLCEYSSPCAMSIPRNDLRNIFCLSLCVSGAPLATPFLSDSVGVRKWALGLTSILVSLLR